MHINLNKLRSFGYLVEISHDELTILNQFAPAHYTLQFLAELQADRDYTDEDMDKIAHILSLEIKKLDLLKSVTID